MDLDKHRKELLIFSSVIIVLMSVFSVVMMTDNIGGAASLMNTEMPSLSNVIIALTSFCIFLGISYFILSHEGYKK